jgi:hypothetical protein
MPIKRLTPQSEIDNHLAELIERKEQAIITHLRYVGERCINEARDAGSYRDQTGNLRSSIGYVVVKDGNIVQMSSFNKVKNGEQGASEGGEFAKQLIGQFPKGICLIVVAGMKYAKYVSARRNVLDSSELLAERLVPDILEQLGLKRR